MRLISTAFALLFAASAALANPVPTSEPASDVEVAKRGGNGDIVYIARCLGDQDDWIRAVWYQNAGNSQNVEYPNELSGVWWDQNGSRYYYMDNAQEVVATLWNLNAAQWQQGGTATYSGNWYNCYRDNDRLLFWYWGNPCWSTFYCV